MKHRTGSLDVERYSAQHGRNSRLLAQAQTLDQITITVGVAIFEVIQQLAALADKLEQTTTGVVVFFVLFEMPGQTIDAGREQGHLNFRRAGIARRALKIGNDLVFGSGIESHLEKLLVVDSILRPRL